MKNIEFAHQVIKMMPQLHRAAIQGLHQDKQILGMNVHHMVVLDLIKEKGPTNMGNIAKALHLSMSSATAVVDRIVRLGLINRARSSADRRSVIVSFKPKGEQTLERLNRVRLETISNLYAPLDDEERAQYLALLTKVYNNIVTG